MVVFPNAKINLGLEILRKREDGYHDLESLFYPIPLKDALEIVPIKHGSGDRWHFSGLEIPGKPSDNLCVKALELLRAEFEIPWLNCFLHKAIPMGAGLGGGSSDVAFLIDAVCEMYSPDFPKERRAEIALAIGSDCPFFLRNEPLMARGRGEIFEPIELDLSGLHLILVCPDIHISTPAAYGSISPSQPDMPVEDILRTSVYNWRDKLNNRFEGFAFKQFPELAKIKAEMYEFGAAYSSMTGSGSSIFGIFEHLPDTLSSEEENQSFRMKL